MIETNSAGLVGPYRQQIDGLRAIAVIGVLYSHFWDEDTAWGTLGVRLFFVISGYLITGILLAARENSGDDRRRVLASFYIRRGLRIWPIYFLTLAAAAVASTRFWPALPWHAMFLSNFYFMREGQWHPWPTAHLWSLSVEEQFYVIWPLIVLFAPRRTLPTVFIATIGTAIAYRATASLFWPQLDFPNIATPAALDALGAGALLAWLERRGHRIHPGTKTIVMAMIASALWITLRCAQTLPYPRMFSLGELLPVIPMAVLVAGSASGFGGWAGKLLNNRMLRAIGKISYGVYLYHLFVQFVAIEASEMVGLPVPDKGPFAFALWGSSTIAVATLSWRLLERPINGLKSRYPYVRKEDLCQS